MILQNKMLSRHNIITVFALLIFACSNAFSQVDENVFRKAGGKNAGTEENAKLAMDRQLNFNSDWRFHLGEVPGFSVPAFDDADWQRRPYVSS
jgi:hypothetical protein